jgi:hypothetical protein
LPAVFCTVCIDLNDAFTILASRQLRACFLIPVMLYQWPFATLIGQVLAIVYLAGTYPTCANQLGLGPTEVGKDTRRNEKKEEKKEEKRD